MSRWRAAGIERLPELRRIIAAADSVMALWIELFLRFERAYQEPRNEELISRIYSFADWCVNAPRNDDASHDPFTAVIVAFYEDIATISAARQDMARWFSYEDVLSNRTVFSHHIGDAEFNELLAIMRKDRGRKPPRA